MAVTLDISELHTFEQAVAAYETLSLELEQASDPIQKKTLLKTVDAIFKHILKTFKTRAAHIFLWETVPDESPVAKLVAQFTYKG